MAHEAIFDTGVACLPCKDYGVHHSRVSTAWLRNGCSLFQDTAVALTPAELPLLCLIACAVGATAASETELQEPRN